MKCHEAYGLFLDPASDPLPSDFDHLLPRVYTCCGPTHKRKENNFTLHRIADALVSGLAFWHWRLRNIGNVVAWRLIF